MVQQMLGLGRRYFGKRGGHNRGHYYTGRSARHHRRLCAKMMSNHVVKLETQTFEGSTQETRRHTAQELQEIYLNRLKEGHNIC